MNTPETSLKQVESTLKSHLPFHKSLQVIELSPTTFAGIVVGIDTDPTSYVEQEADYQVEKIYPVEGV